MKIQVGRFYVNGNGEISKIITKTESYEYCFYDAHSSYKIDGTYSYIEPSKSLIMEIPEDKYKEFLNNVFKEYMNEK